MLLQTKLFYIKKNYIRNHYINIGKLYIVDIYVQSNQSSSVTGYEIMEYIIDNRLIRIIIHTDHVISHTHTLSILLLLNGRCRQSIQILEVNQEQDTHTADIRPSPAISF